MRNLFVGLRRRLRGMLGTGVLWAAIWAPVSLAMFLVQWMLMGVGSPWGFAPVVFLGGAKLGFMTGALFSLALGVTHRNRSFDQITAFRMGILGGTAGIILQAVSLGSAVLGGGFSPPAIGVAFVLGIGATVGASTAVMSLKIAQAAPQEALANGSVEMLGAGEAS